MKIGQFAWNFSIKHCQICFINSDFSIIEIVELTDDFAWQLFLWANFKLNLWAQILQSNTLSFSVVYSLVDLSSNIFMIVDSTYVNYYKDCQTPHIYRVGRQWITKWVIYKLGQIGWGWAWQNCPFTVCQVCTITASRHLIWTSMVWAWASRSVLTLSRRLPLLPWQQTCLPILWRNRYDS